MDASAESSRLFPLNWVRSLTGLLVAVGVNLVLGGLTSYGQTFLPDAIDSVANSASGWTLVTALTVWCTGEQSLLFAAVTGAASFAALNLGYQLTSTARGFFYSGETWFLVAVVTGPAIGMAASWLHRRDLLSAIGTGLLAGIGLGDGLRGLLLLPTTSPVYWILIAASALLLSIAMCARRLPSTRDRLITIAGTLTWAALYNLAISSVF